jgi:hypothetical protein
MGKLFPEVSGQVVTLFAFPACRRQPGRLAPHDVRLQLGQSLRRDSFLAKVPSRPEYSGSGCPVLAPDAPDAAVRIFDSVGAGSGNTSPRQAGPIAEIAFQAISLRSVLHIAGPLGVIDEPSIKLNAL